MKTLLLSGLLSIIFAAHGAAQQTVELVTWYSPSRGDHFSTTQPDWGAAAAPRRSPDYERVRIEGAIFSPEAPQPPGTLPVYSFWNPERGDNFLTSDPAWTSQPSRDGYRRFRLEGYVFEQPVSGTVPLVSFWSGPRADNFATTDPWQRVDQGAVIPNDRSVTTRGAAYRRFRTEGYMLPASADSRSSTAFSRQLGEIGYAGWRPLRPQDRGTRPDDPLQRTASATTPLAVAMIAFADTNFSREDLVRMGSLFGEDSPEGMAAMLRRTSNGRYSVDPTLLPVVRDNITFTQLGPLHERVDGASDLLRRNDPARFQALYGFSMDVYDLDGDGVEASEVHYRTRVLQLIDRFIPFQRYDTNNDGRVDESELLVLRFGADPGIGGQAGGSMDIELDGKQVRTGVLLVAKDTTLAGLTHELMHNWGGVDLYGPGFARNFRSTVMAGMTGDDLFFHFDPWHKMRFGWVEPVFQPIEGSGTVLLGAPGHLSGSEMARPILFYDPARGLDEYFLVEFRTPFPICPEDGAPRQACVNYSDAGVVDTGLVVWHYRDAGEASNRPADVRRRDDPDGRFWWDEDSAPDAHMLHLAVVSAPDQELGRWSYWDGSEGEIALTWWDGSDSGLRLRPQAATRTSRLISVGWNEGDAGFRPRIDLVGVAGAVLGEYTSVRRGQVFNIDGQFGHSGDAIEVTLFGEDGRRVAMERQTFSPTRLLLRVPDSAPEGRYTLAVGNPADSRASRMAALSNGALIEISTGAVTASIDPAVARGLAGLDLGPLVRIDPGAAREAMSADIQLDDLGLEGARPIELPIGEPVAPHNYLPAGIVPVADLAVNPDVLRRIPDTVLLRPGAGTQAGAGQDTCRNAVQGQVAWNTAGNTRWADSNVERLCRGAQTSTEPARCFEQIMSGQIDGGGWTWQPVLDLCEGSPDAGATISCYQRERGAGRDRSAAIARCAE